MKDHPRKRVSPIWHSDIPGMLIFLMPFAIAILTAMVFPLVQSLNQTIKLTDSAMNVRGEFMLASAESVAYLFR
jgi:hypothetical protein